MYTHNSLFLSININLSIEYYHVIIQDIFSKLWNCISYEDDISYQLLKKLLFYFYLEKSYFYYTFQT